MEVSPGAATVPQGGPLVLSCKVEGFRGHEVRVDVDPGDADPTTYSLGRISEESEAGVLPPHRQGLDRPALPVPRRGCPRFGLVHDRHASARHLHRTRADSHAAGLHERRPDSRSIRAGSRSLIPVGSTVTARRPATPRSRRWSCGSAGSEPVPMAAASPESTAWKAGTTVVTGSSLRIEAVDHYDDPLEEVIAYALEPDRAPSIEILSPGARTILPPGRTAADQFPCFRRLRTWATSWWRKSQAGGDSPGRVLMTWEANGLGDMSQTWTSGMPPLRGRDIAFRIRALDQRPGSANESRSPVVVFTLPTLADVSQERTKLEQQAFAGLHQVIELQKQNLAETDRYRGVVAVDLGRCLEDGGRPPAGDPRPDPGPARPTPSSRSGRLTPKVKGLYVREMAAVVDVLRNIPQADPGAADACRRSRRVALQKTILAGLTRAEVVLQPRPGRPPAGRHLGAARSPHPRTGQRPEQTRTFRWSTRRRSARSWSTRRTPSPRISPPS